jgi:hypothetical protein
MHGAMGYARGWPAAPKGMGSATDEGAPARPVRDCGEIHPAKQRPGGK